MNTKLLKIDRCYNCVYCHHVDGVKPTCVKSQKILLKDYLIPDWCLLPNSDDFIEVIMNGIYVFMHICTANQWKSIVEEQLYKIVASGLYDAAGKIFCGVVGKGDISFLREFDNIELAYVHPDMANYEFLTLKWIQGFCKRNPSAQVLYIHTKGISMHGRLDKHPSDLRQRNLDDWRRYLEYFLIYKYKDCLAQLSHNDLVGVLWRGKGTNSVIEPNALCHFSGNFWWAQARYISYLVGPEEGRCKRCNAEFWIGKGHGKVACLHESNVNHYKSRWPPERYNIEPVEPVYYKVKNSESEVTLK